MSKHWKYTADLPGPMRHSVQVQTDGADVDFNLLILDEDGEVLASDRGPEAGALCTLEVRERGRFVFVVELVEGSGSFSLQVASQPLMPDAAPAVAPAPAEVSARTPTDAGSHLTDLSADEIRSMVDAHNRWRERFDVPPVSWSDDLAAYAQQWADELARTGMQMRHRSPNEFGENLYWCSGRPATPEQVVDAWGSEEALYDHEANNWWPQAGHFSQLVWRTTAEVGAGVVRRYGQEIWVCNYNPRGNWTGKRPY